MSHSRCLVSDLDDTLFSTKDAVHTAYYEAGVKPETVTANWGRPWQQWCGVEAHSIKVRAYATYAKDSSLTPRTSAYDVASSLFNHHLAYVMVLTGASHEAAVTLLKRESVAAPLPLLGWSAGTIEKMLALKSVAKRHDETVYLDDDIMASLWVPNDVRFIHYDGQDAETLMKEIGWT